MKYPLTIVYHRECKWISPEMDKVALDNLGLPWYCPVCGDKVYDFINYEHHERAEVERRLPK